MKKIKAIFASIAAAAVISIPLAACSDDDDDKTVDQVPEAFVEALKKVEPDAQNVKWETAGSYRVAEFTKNMVDYDVWFGTDAAWAMTEKDYGKDFFLVPDNAVNEAFAKGEYSSWTVDDIVYYQQTTDEFYVIEVETAGQPDMDLFYTTEGEMFKAIPSDGAPEILPTTVVSR
ncbi:MAG: PepSY-like domain-containing protein [Muribaculaceae bacterium]|nr:PepSY-like domain-containing protein [Muribaculaceae bacterium]